MKEKMFLCFVLTLNLGQQFYEYQSVSKAVRLLEQGGGIWRLSILRCILQPKEQEALLTTATMKHDWK